MSNYPTDVYWSVDGVSLQTYAFNIESLGDARLTLPPPRGENIAIPFRAGQRFVPKLADSRTLTLAMWVQGSDENGGYPSYGSGSAALRLQYETNYRKLRQLLWKFGAQMTLTKRFVIESGAVVSADALAEYAGGSPVTKEGGPYRGKFTVDLLLADPFFYGGGVPLSPSAWATNTSVTVLGDAYSNKASLTFTPSGSCTNPKFTFGPSTATWIQANIVMAAGSTLTVDLENWNVYYTVGASNTNINNKMTRSTPSRWLTAFPGTGVIRADASAGASGNLPVLTYQPAYL